MRSVAASESQEQRALISWASLQGAPEYRLLFAIPNGGYRHILTATRLKAEGVLPGVPDLFLPVARACYHGLFIEMKAKLGKVSPRQKTMFGLIREQGYLVEACSGFESAKEAIESYLRLRD